MEISTTTERLIIRPFADGDLDDLTALIRDKMKSEYAPYDTQWPTDDASMKGILAYYMGEELWNWCAVELKETNRVIGYIPSVKLLHKLGFTKIESIEGSFANDAEGRPIVFAASKYERIV